MKYKPVKIGVIGCGMISDTYMHNLRDTFYITDLAACADLVDAKSTKQAEKYGIRKMTDEELLADPEIELVANLTYASAHYEVSKQILAAGKHCYSEKMIADNMDEARELYALAQEKHLMLAGAPDTFLGAALQTARYVLDRGLIGTPLLAIVSLGRNYQLIKTDADDAYRKYSVVRRGGGLPYDMGGYYLHALFHLFGPVKRVSGVCKTLDGTRPYLNPRHTLFNEPFDTDTENFLCGTLEFASGLTATIALTSDTPDGEHGFTVYGTEGTLYVPDPNEFGNPVYYRRSGQRFEFPLCFPYSASSRGIGIADMAWALRTGRPPRLSPLLAMHALEVVKGIVMAGNTGTYQNMEITFPRPAPLPSGWNGNGSEERNLFLYNDGENVIE